MEAAEIGNEGPESRVSEVKGGVWALVEVEGGEVEGDQIGEARDARGDLADEARIGEVEAGEIG